MKLWRISVRKLHLKTAGHNKTIANSREVDIGLILPFPNIDFAGALESYEGIRLFVRQTVSVPRVNDGF